MSGEFVYLVSCPHYAKNVFKVGRTSSPSSRKKAYGSSAEFIRFEKVTDCKTAEKWLICQFSKRFELVNGNEFFRGDQYKMENSFDDSIVRWKVRDELPKDASCLEKWWGIYGENFRLPDSEYTFVRNHHKLWTYSPDLHPEQTFVVLEERRGKIKTYLYESFWLNDEKLCLRIQRLPRNRVFVDFGQKYVFEVLGLKERHVLFYTLSLSAAFPSLTPDDWRK
nr:hypothetical protein [Marseillevirus cajuinensis]